MTFRRPKQYVLEGGCNLRDLGGHGTKDGRQVTRGLLYRSGVLTFLTPSDHNCVARFKIRTIVDLRRGQEIEEEPTEWLSPVNNISFPEVDQHGPGADPEPWRKRSTLEASRRWIMSSYATMPDWLTPHLQAIFQAILTRELPLLFHCSAGKDRTGFCTAIIYGLLGVPEETVYQEYLLTNEFSDLYAFTKKHRASGMGVTDAAHPIDQMEPEVREALILAHRDYLKTALDSVETGYGGVEAYVKNRLGLSDAEIADVRQLLLDD